MHVREARIHARVCSDGWVSEYIEKRVLQIVHGRRYHRDRRRYEVGYSNNEKTLLREFDEDMKAVFGVRCKRNTGERRTKSKRIFTRLKKLGAGKSRAWFIPRAIAFGSRKIKRAWLTAFYDDEGWVEMRQKRVGVGVVNKRGLKQAAKMLKQLGIPHKLNGPYKNGVWTISINRRGLARFKKIVGFHHIKKKAKLQKILREKT
ncbi:MAG: LAGLIDADG family homing endonuclease [Candidatus Micrarchaeota archaeon]